MVCLVSPQVIESDLARLCSTTVFVSSLPYETTTTDLITHFSFIGPVKNGFVVKDRVSPPPTRPVPPPPPGTSWVC